MPRIAHPQHDEDDDSPVVRRVVSASDTKPPATTAATSVFDAGRKAKPARRPPPAPSEIVIRKGVPKPQGNRIQAGRYLPVVMQMVVGDSVELDLQFAKSFFARAKEHGAACTPLKKFSFRTLSSERGAVWRDE